MHTVKKKLIATTSVNIGCGYSCRKLNLSKIFHPKPNKNKHNHNNHSSSSWTTTTSTTATLSPKYSDSTSDGSSSRPVQGFGWLGGNSLAVEKESRDPYVDFRESMLQMIMEKEIYDKDDLRDLLNCFLQLNSPYYHVFIVNAFAEIWNNIPN